MKERIRNFWRDPVNKFWLFGTLASLFFLSYGAFRLYRQDLNNTVALLLISIALISELIFLIAMIMNSFSDTKNDYLELFQKINRHIRYRYYLKKNKDKQYKGPSWKDDIFEKITDTNQRVDAYVKASIEFQQADFEAWKRKNIGINLDSRDHTITRSFLIICAAIVSFLLLLSLLTWLGFGSAKITELIENSKGTVLLGIFTTFIGSPVIFIVWLFRDKNNRVQIENARKDTNLKDFQKLSEWASGFHLPEIKQTTSNKTTRKTKKEDRESDETTHEEITSQEDFLPPYSSNSISRRQGAEALQASAIAQLEAFMLGKYGEQFMQPAFLLIHAIWESILQQQQEKFPIPYDFQDSLEKLHKNPIVSAVNKALLGAGGAHLWLFSDNLQGLNLTALDSYKTPLTSINLSGLEVRHIDFSFAVLWGSNLVATNLAGAHMKNSILRNTNMQKVTFLYSNLENADLSASNLQCADLSHANLRYANLSYIDMQSANFSHSKLENSNLSYSDIRGCDFSFANLSNTSFNKARIDRSTTFDQFASDIDIAFRTLENLLQQGAIWYDDPDYLVNLIKDSTLIDKARTDYIKRTQSEPEDDFIF